MADSTIEKACYRCKQTKSISNFYLIKNRNRFRRHSYCKDCANPHCQRAKPLHERFWSKVDKSSDCWEWTACRNNDGYGTFGYQRRVVGAHILSYEFSVGPVPPGLCVLHKCDNPPCVRPDHLFLGTKKDNSDDCIQKGRRVNQKGENNGQAKLTEDQVREIRRTYSESTVTYADLGRRYNVSAFTIKEVVNFERWKHVA